MATRQIGHMGIIDRTNQPNGEIRFPDWAAVLRGIKTTSEVTVHFKPILEIPGPAELLNEARAMTIVFATGVSTHVIAAIRDDNQRQVTFRRYDTTTHDIEKSAYVSE